MKIMEDHQHDFVVLSAGYDTRIDNFLESNPRLPGRISNLHPVRLSQHQRTSRHFHEVVAEGRR